MSEIEVGVRELRNRTAHVIAALDAGRHVVLTNHGRRIASITPLARHARTERILAALDVIPPYNSGLADVVAYRRRADRALERDWA